MTFEWEEGHLRKTGKVDVCADTFGDFAPHVRPIPPARANTIAPEFLPPFSDLVEVACQDCGGACYDPGSLDAVAAESCPTCLGSGKEIVLRNYLAEAFRIAADPEANLRLERAHLVALTAYARQTVSALLMSSPEVA
jgi:hypothetical protein